MKRDFLEGLGLDKEKMTKDELLAYAAEYEIEGVSAAMNKADILAVLQAAV